MFYVFGLPLTLLGILENLGTWKAAILFFLSALLLIVRIYYYVIDKEQQRKKKNMEIEQQRFELDKTKKDKL